MASGVIGGVSTLGARSTLQFRFDPVCGAIGEDLGLDVQAEYSLLV